MSFMSVGVLKKILKQATILWHTILCVIVFPDGPGIEFLKQSHHKVILVRSVQCVMVGHLKNKIVNALYFIVLVPIPIGYDSHMN